jgi:hypothetical protein
MNKCLLQRPWTGPAVKHPRPVLLLDDLQGTRILTSSKPFINLLLRNRHVAPKVPLSILIATQSLKSGIPRQLRSNVSYWVVFPTMDTTVLKDLYREISGHNSLERFSTLFRHSTSERHSPLCVDLT